MTLPIGNKRDELKAKIVTRFYLEGVLNPQCCGEKFSEPGAYAEHVLNHHPELFSEIDETPDLALATPEMALLRAMISRGFRVTLDVIGSAQKRKKGQMHVIAEMRGPGVGHKKICVPGPDVFTALINALDQLATPLAYELILAFKPMHSTVTQPQSQSPEIGLNP